LCWYEYDLYILKFNKKNEHEKEKQLFEWESAWERTRVLWVDFRNVHSKKQFKPQDLIKLSIDKHREEEKKVEPLTPKQMKEAFGSKFKKNGE
jgi:hypothetical protein